MDERTYTRTELLEALTLEPCHITGMHSPHHTTRYVCNDQRAAGFRRVLKLLDVAESELPRQLGEDCGWCHRVPTQEKYREELREIYRWAEEPIPAELAAPAPDAPVFDLPKRKVWRALTKEWQSIPDLWEKLGLPRHSIKIQRPLAALVEEGAAKETCIDNLYHWRRA